MSENNINPVLARAVEHFRERQEQRFEAMVPEWGGEDQPLVLYATPMTMAERRKVQKSNPNDNYGATCDIIIAKAEDADGKKVFSKKDKPYFLNRIDPEVIARVAGELLGGEEMAEPEMSSQAMGDLGAGIDEAGKD